MERNDNAPAARPSRLLRLLHFTTLCYAVFLTLLLWLPDPRMLFGGWRPVEDTGGYEHLIAFSLLAFFVELGRRRYGFFFWASMLLGYTLITEIVQECTGFRSFEIVDIVQDLAGLYLGFWAAGLCRRFPFPKREKEI